MGLLSLEHASLRFGGIVALDDVSLEVEKGTITGLIGPNGAGKTTAFNVITRLYRLESGDVVFDGHSLLRTQPSSVVKLGITRTFQNVELFPTMTVHENVLVGAHVRRGKSVSDLLAELGLAQIAQRPAGGLPFGTMKRVELARALASGPRLLLLDEPAGGLNHEEVERLGDLIRSVRKVFGVTILMVEHHLNFVMRVSDRVVALDFGKTLAEGTPAEMQVHPEVIRAYLGAPA
jgi:branched-chain amino acid transport system ATP-binding protein